MEPRLSLNMKSFKQSFHKDNKKLDKMKKSNCLFDNYEHFLNVNSISKKFKSKTGVFIKSQPEDFTSCYNLNRLESKTKNVSYQKRNKININFILNSEEEELESEDKSQPIFRETFLTKVSDKFPKLEDFEKREIPLYAYSNKERSNMSLKEIMKEVNSVQKKIDNEAEDIKALLDYTSKAKERLMERKRKVIHLPKIK